MEFGSLLGTDLDFVLHREHTIEKETNMVYTMFRALFTRNAATLLRAFKTYVRQLLEYGTVAYNFKKSRTIVPL